MVNLHIQQYGWVKSQLGILCPTEQFKAYKTLEWLGTCASVWRILYYLRIPQDVTVLNLLLNQFIFYNSISQYILYHNNFTVTLKRVGRVAELV